jgi:cytochrome P450
MEDFAGQLPMSIILKMVGVPTQDQAMLKDWVLQILASDDPEYAKNGGDVIATTGRFMQYAHMLAAERSKSPQDDLLSQLMAAKVNGVKLTYDEFGMFFILLLGAGTHTTQLLLGNAALALMENPAQRQRLVRDPALVQSGVEEVLRFSPPFIHFRRTARIDTELGGQQIRAGDKVVVWYVSANRDEEVFPEPNSFDVGRSPNDHLSFGYGPHFCLGNALGRLTAKTALAECVRRMPEMAPNGPRVRLRSNWFNGLKRLPVVAG